MHTLTDLFQRVVSLKWQGSIGLSSETGAIRAPEFFGLLTACLNRLETHIKHNDVVLVRVDSNLESICLILTLWQLGAVVVPVKRNVDSSALALIAEDCNARYLIDPAGDDVQPLSSYQETTGHFVFHCSPKVSGTDRALIIYTSGSTGNPKGIILSHTNVITALRAISDYLKIDPQERILNISPLSFDYGLYQVLFAIYKDCSVILYDEAVNPITLVKAIERQQITLIPALPVIATLLAKGAQICKKSLPMLRKLTNTGGHLDEHTIDALLAQMPNLQIYAMYGLTESKRALYLPPADIHRKRGSVGIPMPGLEAKVFNEVAQEDGSFRYIEAAPGQIGHLYVRGPSVMQGYTRSDADAGARLIPGLYRDDNWLDTGDLFMRDEEGYFYFKGRAKELIKQGGYCLYAADIETAVLAHAQIQFASVVGTKDRFGNEIACLFIKLDDHALQHPPQDILDWIELTLGADYCPRMIKVVEDIKLSVNGKIDKKQMLAAYS